jgi:fructokinase
VGTSFLQIMKGRRTPVALAFLDDQGDAAYSFYKDYPAQRLRGEWPVPEKDDIVLFGSFYSLDPAIREVLLGFLLESRENGATLIYDPNIRRNHLDEIRKLMPRIGENISLAHLVRGSDEDFQNIFGLDDMSLVFNSVRSLGCPRLIITRGKLGAEMMAEGIRFSKPALPVEVISTIGAGDAFNAGMIHALAGFGTGTGQLDHVPEETWQEIVTEGIRFSAEVCAGFDNYIAKRNSG